MLAFHAVIYYTDKTHPTHNIPTPPSVLMRCKQHLNMESDYCIRAIIKIIMRTPYEMKCLLGTLVFHIL
jgi:hypothetical protein